MDTKAHFKKVRTELNEKSSSLCLAKWLQVTIHLQNGMTHSCHHPHAHKIPLEEIKEDPGALHNTKFKKEQRKKMLESIRPAECDYCWKIEDSAPDNFSDRTYKSADHWAYPHFQKVLDQPWDQSISPTYVEVSFGNECQFKCAYCSPIVSSGILSEYHKHGHYDVQPYFALDHLKQTNQYPYSKDEYNPYVEAFWKWWPELSKNLEVFRITGGEPLLNPNTFKFLESIINSPMPNLDVAINSNLNIPDSYFNRFLKLASEITSKKLVKHFEIYTSVDTYGEHAEYIRHGLNFNKLIENIETILQTLPETKIVIMCTFNALSVPGFEKFISLLKDLKLKYPDHSGIHSRLQLSIPYLRNPMLLAANVLPSNFHSYIEKSLNLMLRNAVEKDPRTGGDFFVFSEYEISQLRRILEWLKNSPLNEGKSWHFQKHFYSFFKQYDQRKGTSLLKTFPELTDFIRDIEKRLKLETSTHA